MLVLPQPVRASGGRRGSAMGAGVGAGRVRWDLPHLLSTRRIGARSVPGRPQVRRRLALRRNHWNPRLTLPDSLMPRFPWLFVDITAPVRRDGERRCSRSPGMRRSSASAAIDRSRSFPTPVASPSCDLAPTAAFPIDVCRHRPHGVARPAFSESSVRLVIPKADLVALVSYIQRSARPGRLARRLRALR